VCSLTLTGTVLFGVDVRWYNSGCGTDSSVWQVLVQATLGIAALQCVGCAIYTRPIHVQQTQRC